MSAGEIFFCEEKRSSRTMLEEQPREKKQQNYVGEAAEQEKAELASSSRAPWRALGESNTQTIAIPCNPTGQCWKKAMLLGNVSGQCWKKGNVAIIGERSSSTQ